MHHFEDAKYGFRLQFDGYMNRNDMEAWFADLQKQVGKMRGPFGAVIDLRGAVAFPAEAQEILFKGIHYCLEQGMERNAVVVANAIAKIQATRISKETGTAANVRFIDAASDPQWEQKAEAWVVHGTDPK